MAERIEYFKIVITFRSGAEHPLVLQRAKNYKTTDRFFIVTSFNDATCFYPIDAVNSFEAIFGVDWE